MKKIPSKTVGKFGAFRYISEAFPDIYGNYFYFGGRKPAGTCLKTLSEPTTKTKRDSADFPNERNEIFDVFGGWESFAQIRRACRAAARRAELPE